MHGVFLKSMTGDILLSNMLFRYKDLSSAIKMPDSPESIIKTSSNSAIGVNGNHSPRPPAGTPSPPMTSSSSTNPPEVGVSRNKAVSRMKKFLSTLKQCGQEKSTEMGERVHSLIISLVHSTVTIEDFHHKVHEITNYPLQPFVLPFLKSYLPLLQAELIHYARLSKQTLQQYLRQHENVLYDEDTFQDTPSGSKRTRNGKIDDYIDQNGDGLPHPKRHQPNAPAAPRTSPQVPSLAQPPGLSNIRLAEEHMLPFRDREGRMDRFERFERDLYRPLYGNLVREFTEDREMDEEWRNIHTMLNCILGMVEKTKRAICILQHRYCPDVTWLHHKHFKADSEARRRAEAVQEVKRAAVAELQKAAECKATELLAAERLKMERLIAEARRQAAEEASRQEESTETCWNCGRKANETCSGCNVARYCGSFCQHKDWDTHLRVCNASSTPPRSSSDHSPSPDVKPLVKIDVV